MVLVAKKVSGTFSRKKNRASHLFPLSKHQSTFNMSIKNRRPAFHEFLFMVAFFSVLCP